MNILLSLAAELVTSLLFLGLASLAVYWALLKKLKPLTAVLAGALIVLVYFGGSFAADQMSTHTDVWKAFQQSFDDLWQLKAKELAADKMLQADIDARHSLFIEYFLYCLPAWFALSALLTGFISYYLVSVIASRFILRLQPPIPFWQWSVPEPMIFGLILGCVARMFAEDNSWLSIIGDNLLVFFLIVYTFASLPIVSFYFRKWRFGSTLRFLGYLTFFTAVFVIPVLVLSVMDIWLDFRKMKKPLVELSK